MFKNINFQQKRWLPLIALMGFVLLILLVMSKSEPELLDNASPGPLVEVHVVKKQPFDPVITGFGRVQPRESWAAISEVSGRVIFRHPELEKGRTLPKDTVIVKIDPVDYQLALAQSRSSLKSAELEVERVNLNQRSFKQSRQIELGRLKIFEDDLKRKKDLNNQGLVSSSELEAQQNQVLAQEKLVWDLDSKLALIPTDMEVAQANLKVAEAKVTEAERSLSRTEIVLPFNARIGAVEVELDQVVGLQQTMLEAHDVSQMEITASMSLFDMRRLVQAISDEAYLPANTIPDIRNLPLQSTVSLVIGQQNYSWQGHVDRVDDSIDTNANTIGVTVQVDNSFTSDSLRDSPPLLKDMYVQVNIKGKGRNLIVVPSRAIHGNKIYVVGDDNRLSMREADIAFQQLGSTALLSNISQGEKVILTDLLAPVEGMMVRVAAGQSAKVNAL